MRHKMRPYRNLRLFRFSFWFLQNPYTYREYDQYTQINYIFRNDGHRADCGCNAKYHKNVEDIGTDRVAKCHINFILSRSNDRSYEFRKGSSDGNNGQSDQSLAHSEIACDSRCGIYGHISADCNGDCSADDEHDTLRNRKQLDVLVGTTFNFDFFPSRFAFKAI